RSLSCVLAVVAPCLVACGDRSASSSDLAPPRSGPEGTPTDATGGAGRDGSGDPSPGSSSAPGGGDVDVDLGPPAVRFTGRFDAREVDGPKCGWPGCRIVARFTGTR